MVVIKEPSDFTEQGPRTVQRRFCRAPIPCLTSLRFAAALAIVIHHGADQGLVPAPWLSGMNLALGVSFFFVLSGFVLGYAYHERAFTKRDFYRARFARIWPATACSLFLVPLLLPRALYLPMAEGPWGGLGSFLLCLLMLQALVPVPTVYFAFNAVTWSISTEFCFYLAFPWLQAGVWRNLVLTLSLVGVVGLSMAALAEGMGLPAFGTDSLTVPGWHGLIYIHPLARMQEFLFGLVAARLFLCHGLQRTIHRLRIAERSRFRLFGCLEASALVGLVVLANRLQAELHSAFTPISPSLALLLGHWAAGLCFALLILILAMEAGWLSSIVLALPPLVLLGELSFSLYLFHQIVMKVMVSAHPELLAMLPAVAHLPLIALASVVLALLSHRWIERPGRVVLLRHRPGGGATSSSLAPTVVRPGMRRLGEQQVGSRQEGRPFLPLRLARRPRYSLRRSPAAQKR